MTFTHKEEKISDGQGSVDDMEKYGITCIPVNYFYYKSFRYTNLDDAIAQAKRDGTVAGVSGDDKWPWISKARQRLLGLLNRNTA